MKKPNNICKVRTKVEETTPKRGWRGY